MQKCFCGEVLWKWNSCGQWCDDSQGTQPLWCVLLLLVGKKYVEFWLLTLEAGDFIHSRTCQAQCTQAVTVLLCLSRLSLPPTVICIPSFSLLLLSGWLNLNLLISPQCGQRCGMCQSIYSVGLCYWEFLPDLLIQLFSWVTSWFHRDSINCRLTPTQTNALLAPAQSQMHGSSATSCCATAWASCFAGEPLKSG